MAWVALPPGHDVIIKRGFSYAGIVSVDKMHTKADLLAQAAKHGLNVWDYGEYPERQWLGQDPNSDRRRVSIAATATSDAGSLPWSTNIPFLVHYNIIAAWYAGPGELPKGKASDETSVAPYVIFAAAAAGGAWLWWRYRKHRRVFA